MAFRHAGNTRKLPTDPVESDGGHCNGLADLLPRTQVSQSRPTFMPIRSLTANANSRYTVTTLRIHDTQIPQQEFFK